ncbi:MAG: hypothetical protein AAF488_04015, partial [Planctomycetota bacterium]
MNLKVRLICIAILFHGLFVGNGQGLFVKNGPTLKEMKVPKVERNTRDEPRYSNTLVVEAWLSDKNHTRNQIMGLRFKPSEDPNVYLLCNYKTGSSRAEIGLSMSNFAAMTITYGYRLPF